MISAQSFSCGHCGEPLGSTVSRGSRKFSGPPFLFCPYCNHPMNIRNYSFEWFLLTKSQQNWHLAFNFLASSIYSGMFLIVAIGFGWSFLKSKANWLPDDASFIYPLSAGLILSFIFGFFDGKAQTQLEVKKSYQRLLDVNYLHLLEKFNYLPPHLALQDLLRMRDEFTKNRFEKYIFGIITIDDVRSTSEVVTHDILLKNIFRH